ncbi:hypothetical protein I553_3052 [Mycobacterium xenopi 4042]|uniref:Uncharacterized protein n=1 Tax=Mycobacterium xenopi 4042 TaxID=1299334 RepID=X8BM16_MYCXE|nr:hypothetical protein I553_3052 [Mycobacterium xenopi 4042]
MTSRRARCGDWSTPAGADLLRCGSTPPATRLTGKVADRDVFGGAHPLDLRLDVALSIRAALRST